MRILSLTMIFASMMISQAALSKEKTVSPKPAKAFTEETLTAEQSEALGAAARRKADAQQRAWDDKTKNITKGICSGC
jgi:hypothetical protein